MPNPEKFRVCCTTSDETFDIEVADPQQTPTTDAIWWVACICMQRATAQSSGVLERGRLASVWG
jgi:hypothetical protein